MRLVIVLSIILMLSATALVTVRFSSRELFVASERLKSKASGLDMEWRRLQLERAELASNSRVSAIAKTKLGLIPIGAERTIYIQKSEPAQTKRGQP